MATGIAHEINRPLQIIGNIVDTHLELLKRGFPSVINDSQIKEISEQIERTGFITSQMRTFGRDVEDLQFQEHNINEIVKKIMDFLSIQLKNRSIEIHTDLKNIPLIMCNHIQIGQVLTNLFLNAKDALNKNNEKQIQIKTYAKEDRAFIEFHDNGIGIPEEIHNKVFDPFFTSKSRGTGLGLSISYGIMKEHGGDIRVKESSKKGTTFLLEFPL